MPVKNLLAAPKKIMGMMWLLSLGLHGFVLMLPVTSEPPIAEKPVRVVNVSKQPVVPAVKTVQQPAVKTPATRKSAVPRPTVPARRKVSSPQTSVLSQPKPPMPKPSAPPSAKSEPPVLPKVEKVIADFSETAKAQPGCKANEECWQLDETQWRVVAKQLTQRLEAQGCSVGKLDDLDDDTGMGIYQVIARNGEKTFLHLLLTDRGTVYVLDPNQLTRTQLQQRMAS